MNDTDARSLHALVMEIHATLAKAFGMTPDKFTEGLIPPDYDPWADAPEAESTDPA